MSNFAITCLSPFFAAISLLSTLPVSSFEIREQPHTEDIGYDSCSIFHNGELTLIQNFFEEGYVVFDVGANRGEWSRQALEEEPSIRLYSFEPIPQIFNVLKMNFLNKNNVAPFNCAMSDEVGTANFWYYSSSAQASELSGFNNRPILKGVFKEPEMISVSLETLDHFCSSQMVQKIDFLKIDTEGAEWKVLNGAMTLLKNHQIRSMQFEYGGCYTDSGTTLEQVIRLLTENHYAIFRIIPNGLIHISHWEPSLETFRYSNYFAICHEDMPSYGLVQFDR